MTGAVLEGLRVLDLADWKGLPCTKLLADMGADVIKIEKPGGDDERSRPPFAGDIPHPERSLYFLHYNANKRGITLDLETPDGRELFRRLIQTADVLVETFKPGTLESWGLGWDQLSASNPRLVLTSITLFGQSGPWRDYEGDELVAFAFGGLLALSGEPGGPPVVAPGEMSAGIASVHAALATQVALWHRRISGRGQRIDIAVADASLHVGSYVVPHYSHDHKKPLRETHTQHATELAHDLYRCKDGWVRLFVIDRGHWRSLVEWLDDPEVADPAFDDPHVRAENMHRIAPVVDRLCSRYTKQEMYLEGERRHLAVTPVCTPAEFVESEQTKGRGFFQEIEHPVVGTYGQAGLMHRYSEAVSAIERAAPLVGQHNDEILRGELGLSRDDLVVLKANGVI
jgi:crotonobetainyl-CoA:carnitine CoA-transferase CaiB-like acyl-CoA transferase